MSPCLRISSCKKNSQNSLMQLMKFEISMLHGKNLKNPLQGWHLIIISPGLQISSCKETLPRFSASRSEIWNSNVAGKKSWIFHCSCDIWVKWVQAFEFSGTFLSVQPWDHYLRHFFVSPVQGPLLQAIFCKSSPGPIPLARFCKSNPGPTTSHTFL